MVIAGGATAGGMREYPSSDVLATLLVEPLAELGSSAPALDASFVADGVIGKLTDLLWQRTAPTRADVARTVELSLRVAGAPTVGRST
jgi:hypothetical protein